MDLNLKHLRDLVTKIPRASTYSHSVQMLEEAFDYSFSRAGVPWDRLRRGCDIEFFGNQTLESLFGDEYDSLLRERRLFLDGPWRYEADVWSNYRLEFQQYAVVGRRATPAGEEAACLILHRGPIPALDGMERPPEGSLGAAALLRIRAGLMNHRQAHLLASHLNRFRNNDHHREKLTWSVVQGPGPDANARRWADGVIGRRSLLRVWSGAENSWGLGEQATCKLSAYLVDCCARQTHRVISYGSPQVLLPPRYEVVAEFNRSSGQIPKGFAILASRLEPCKDAGAMAQVLERTGQIHGAGQPWDPEIGDVWGEVQDGVPGSCELAYMQSPAGVYSSSLSREEAIATMKRLRVFGFWRVGARRVGVGGSYVRYDGGHPHFSRYEKVMETQMEVPMEKKDLRVRLVGCLSVDELSE